MTDTPRTDELTEEICAELHDAYERAAEKTGWQTQNISRKPWDELPEANANAMRDAIDEVVMPLIKHARFQRDKAKRELNEAKDIDGQFHALADAVSDVLFGGECAWVDHGPKWLIPHLRKRMQELNEKTKTPQQ